MRIQLLLIKQSERHCMSKKPLGNFLSIAAGFDQISLEFENIANNQVDLQEPFEQYYQYRQS